MMIHNYERQIDDFSMFINYAFRYDLTLPT